MIFSDKTSNLTLAPASFSFVSPTSQETLGKTLVMSSGLDLSGAARETIGAQRMHKESEREGYHSIWKYFGFIECRTISSLLFVASFLKPLFQRLLFGTNLLVLFSHCRCRALRVVRIVIIVFNFQKLMKKHQNVLNHLFISNH